MPAAAVDSQMGVARSLKALRARVEQWRRDGLSVAFVPTMGALHEGHLSLLRRASQVADRTVASIFVNPRQFAAHEDLGAYPRQEAQDLELLQNAGCALAYTPSAEEMYPPGYQTSVSVGEIGHPLCGVSRPHFFGGVATVVCKLLNQVRPDIAVFGEKDYQQLLVIRRMVRDLNMGVEIIGAETVREPDGLAMSSRNAYLSPAERAIAGRINGVISEMAGRLAAGEPAAAVAEDGRRALLHGGVDRIDYLETRDAETLAAVEGRVEKPARVFVAAMVGKTRLIDNWPVPGR